VISYDLGGPAEILLPDVNGWLASSDAEFLKLCAQTFESGYRAEVRAKARESSQAFSLESTSARFLEHLKGFLSANVAVREDS
jgi:glycosyltransferase involved in cell wall biosynthesis